MRASLITLVALVAAVIVTDAAAQAPGVQRAPGSSLSGQPLLAYDARGGLVAAWLPRSDRAPFAYAAPEDGRLRRTPSGPRGRRHVVRADVLAAHGDGEAIGVTAHRGGVLALHRRSSGRIVAPVRLAGRKSRARETVVAATPDGDALAAWIARRSGRDRVEYAWRPAGRGWRRPRTAVTGRSVGDLAVAVSPGGNAVLAWRRGGHVEAATGVRRLGRPVVAGPAVTGAGGNLDVAVSDESGVLVAWLREPGFSGNRRAARQEVLVARGTVAGGFDAAVSLDRSLTSALSAGPRAALGPGGSAVVSWRGADAEERYVVRAVTANAGGPLSLPRDVSVPGAFGAPRAFAVEAGITPAGRVVVVWTTSALGAEDDRSSRGSVQRAQATADGGWTAPVTVWETDAGRPENLTLATGPDDRLAFAWDSFGTDAAVRVAFG